MSEGTFNPTRRRLCPDGACIGVIGDDGSCRVCGRAGNDSAAGSGPAPATDRDADSDRDADTSDSFREADGAAFGADDSNEEARHAGGDLESAVAPGAFHPDRRLCDDGSCVGVIGAGDVCSVCGRPAGG